MALLQKLRFNTDLLLYAINVPGDCLDLFEGIQLKKNIPSGKQADQLILFAEDGNTLDTCISKLEGKMSDGAVFWIAYPKKSGRIQSDLIRNNPWEYTFRFYTCVSSVSINDDWSGLRFKKKDPARASVPMEQRKTEGIDYVARTVSLPADALKAMKPFKGLDEFFYAMSFSHKREYLEAIAGAKKPETRQRRIEKMIEMLLVLRTEKELKSNKTKQ
jgi:hypothetical protein